MKNFLLLISVIFIYRFVYQYPDVIGTDRDNALIITSERFQAGLNPYEALTNIGNPITTGTTSILYALIISERNLAFLFWLWLVTIFYTGSNFILYAMIFLFTLIFFQRSIMYRLEELYFGMIPMYYSLKKKSGWLMSLALLNRIAYLPFGILLAIKNKKTILSMVAGVILLSMIVNPIDMIENNIAMVHVPKYPLDYFLLGILPVMFFFNNKNIKDFFFHRTELKPIGYGYDESGYMYYEDECVYCGEREKKIQNIYD